MRSSGLGGVKHGLKRVQVMGQAEEIDDDDGDDKDGNSEVDGRGMMSTASGPKSRRKRRIQRLNCSDCDVVTKVACRIRSCSCGLVSSTEYRGQKSTEAERKVAHGCREGGRWPSRPLGREELSRIVRVLTN